MIYLDYFSTTPVDERILDFYTKTLREHFGNASSVDHDLGGSAAAIVRASRQKIADLMGCQPAEITFTSGATESISLFLQGYAAGHRARRGSALRVATSPVEHAAVLENLAALQKAGSIELTYLGIDSLGRIDLAEVENACQKGLDLVCIMAANNEIGNVYPTEKIAAITAQFNTFYFCDATQAIGKIPFSLEILPNTIAVFSGHKFYAPKGIGVLVADTSLPVLPLLHGGGQQRALRPGTINAPLIATLAQALDIAVNELDAEARRIAALRDTLEANLVQDISSLVINGDRHGRLPGALHVSLPGQNNKQLISRLRSALAISTGASCSSGSERPSHVLTAMHMPRPNIEGALRISLGRLTTTEEIYKAAQLIGGVCLNF